MIQIRFRKYILYVKNTEYKIISELHNSARWLIIALCRPYAYYLRTPLIDICARSDAPLTTYQYQDEKEN
jgi:hypothetical protein